MKKNQNNNSQSQSDLERTSSFNNFDINVKSIEKGLEQTQKSLQALLKNSKHVDLDELDHTRVGAKGYDLANFLSGQLWTDTRELMSLASQMDIVAAQLHTFNWVSSKYATVPLTEYKKLLRISPKKLEQLLGETLEVKRLNQKAKHKKSQK